MVLKAMSSTTAFLFLSDIRSCYFCLQTIATCFLVIVKKGYRMEKMDYIITYPTFAGFPVVLGDFPSR